MSMDFHFTLTAEAEVIPAAEVAAQAAAKNDETEEQEE
jgi:hypothetical protein